MERIFKVLRHDLERGIGLCMLVLCRRYVQEVEIRKRETIERLRYGARDGHALLLRLLPCLFGLVALGCHFFCIEQDRLLFVRACCGRFGSIGELMLAWAKLSSERLGFFRLFMVEHAGLERLFRKRSVSRSGVR